LQPSLLRVLEDGKVAPLGENRQRQVDFRLIVATHRDLRAEVAAGRFRMDLLYRVSVTSITIPALRERQEDIPALVEHFSHDIARRHGIPVKRYESEVLHAFEHYPWPGNARELRNVVEGMMLMTTGETLTLTDLPSEFAATIAARKPPHGAPGAIPVTGLEAVEREAIIAAILSSNGNLTQVARELHIAKSTLYLKIKKFELDHVLQTVKLSGQ
jgi:sigma-54 dependent transcriptional regulator, acetoin dehydrogenase operon transcriptional activator AcoR